MNDTAQLLTTAQLAERWLFTTRKGKPDTPKVVALIEAGHLPNAFRVDVGAEPGGRKVWRIPLADVLDFERGRRPRPPKPEGESTEEESAPRRRGRPRIAELAPAESEWDRYLGGKG